MPRRPCRAADGILFRDSDMQRDPVRYTVVGVDRLGRTQDEVLGTAPPEVLERFEGRTFTLEELQQRGVRIAGGRAVYTAEGLDWRIQTLPSIGSEEP